MARVLHGMSIDSLPAPGNVKDDDRMVAYRKEDGMAYSVDVSSLIMGDFVDKVYPVGSIYMSINQIDPGTLFGGEWTQIEDCFLLAAGNHGGGETGGSETVTLTSSQIPSHMHSIPSLSGTAASAGAHRHDLTVETNAVASGTDRHQVYQGGDATNSSIVQSAGAHTHNVTTNSSTTGSNGSGNAHNNMPPYLAVYMWQRIS